MKNMENDVYVIGGKKRAHWLRYVIIALCIAAGIALWLAQGRPKRSTQPTQELNAIEVLPENAMSPKFDGQYDFSEFLKWAKVVVAFVITQEGAMADVEIVSQPEQKAFGQQVVSLLKTCPKWAPARLADGTATNMRYTLPVKFKTPQ